MTSKLLLNLFASLEDWIQAIKKYIADNPQKNLISAEGFSTRSASPNAAMLDAICTDKSIVVESFDKHSMWLNSKEMEEFGINKDAVAKWGTDCVRIDADGNPTDFISENPNFYVRALIKISVDEMKAALLAWQNYSLSNGYTGVYNASLGLLTPLESLAYYALEEEGKLKFYTYSGIYIVDNTDTPEEDMDKVAAESKKNSKHYKIVGAKVFSDGVVEGHTAWLWEDYTNQPDYKGVSRFDDHEKMVRLTHLHVVRKEDIKRIAE